MLVPRRALLIAIVGPTAVGKSDLALRVASEFGAEIVSADSRQVYKYMDIGTAKPSTDEQQRVQHHMIDVVAPDEPYTLADYQDQASTVVADLHERHIVPVLAGGTPLYVNALLEGWTIPRVEPRPEFRQQLELEASQQGSIALHARLAALDPTAASRILPTNTRRIIRALEVIEVTGLPISHQQQKQPPDFRVLTIGLTCDREELYRRMDERVDRMLDWGLVQEVEALHARGYAFDLPSMSGIGYRQIGTYLQGKATLEEAVQRIKWDTHAFSRHQYNWFRRNKDTVWLDTTTDPATELALELVASFLSATGAQ